MREGWSIVSLATVCDFQNGFAFKSKTFKESGTPVIRITNIQNESVDLSNVVFIDRSDYDKDLSKYEITKGDLLIAMSGATTGKIGVHQTDEVLLLNQRVGKFEPSGKLNKVFLFYYLSTKVEESLAISAGSAQPNLSTEQIKNFQIPIPPLTEQKQIVALLDKAFAAIDQAKANIEKNIENAKELFQSKLNEIFLQKGAGWEEVLLKDIIEVKHGFAFKSEFFKSSGDYVLLTPGNYYEEGGYRDRKEKQKYYQGEIPDGYILDKDDLLVAMTEQAAGLLGSPLLVPESGKYLHNQRLGLIRIKDGVELSTRFLYHVFNTKKLRKEIHHTGTGLKVRHTSPTKISEIIVSVNFDDEVQQKVIEVLMNLQLASIETVSKYVSKLSNLEELQKSILQKAFTGELTRKEVVV
ncbi:restriction endonuclease subunit S [Owenweeksia hongkongensis]|uniref:restriction endonuclease subunit S n=1 Tax=Owenweeksia hongkongensis TaxID=253245 RepID=UPI003A8F168E